MKKTSLASILCVLGLFWSLPAKALDVFNPGSSCTNCLKTTGGQMTGALEVSSASFITDGGGASFLGNAPVASSGTLVIQSTSSTGANPILSLIDNNGNSQFRFRNDGTWLIGTGRKMANYTLGDIGDTSNGNGNVPGSTSFVMYDSDEGGDNNSGYSLFISYKSGQIPAVGNGPAIAFQAPTASSKGPVTLAGIRAMRLSATANNSNAALAFNVKDNSADIFEAMRIDHTGSLGIGNTAPLGLLDVRSSTGTTQFVTVVSSQDATAMTGTYGDGTFQLKSKTRAQIATITPKGGMVIIGCSDCNTIGTVCVSTGATLAGFAQIGSTTKGCGPAE